MKKHLLFVPVLLIGLLASCGGNEEKPNPQPGPNPDPVIVSVESIKLNKNSLQLNERDSETLTYTINPSDATNKDVTWESSNAIIASVENGVVKAWNAGTADITVTTLDGNKTDVCKVTVVAATPEKKIIKDSFALNEQGYSFSGEQTLLNNPLTWKDYSISFSQGTNPYSNNNPRLIKATNKHYEARIYWGNTFTVTSTKNKLVNIEFVLGENDKGNAMTCSTGTIDENGVWVGEAKEINFTVTGASGYRAFETFTLCYEGQTEDDPEVFINLGQKTIAEVRDYIEKNPVKKNAFGNGVNEKRLVTIKGFALAKIDLEKFTAKYGLDVSEHGKVIMADNSGFIGCATAVNGQGTCLWGKIADNACKPTSKYIITGYLSEYLGHPEILVESFVWDKDLDMTLDLSKITTGVKTLTEFYTASENLNYNCAGHAYGDVITVKDLKCYYVESDGQGKRYYNFTDGSKNIRVNAFNLTSGATEGKVYDVTGVISLKNLSPIIVAFEIKTSTSSVDFNYEDAASSITVAGLKKIHGSQDDTLDRYPEVIIAYSNFYKTTGYMCAVQENGKLYVGISDTYQSKVITGKTNAMANYNVVLIKNDNFWDTTEEELFLFNPYYEDYLMEDNPITIYYVTRQLTYSSKKPMWEILLVPESIPAPVEE